MTQDNNQSRHLKAGAGWDWFVIAIKAVRAQPFRLFLMTFFYMIVMGISSFIPMFGVIVTALFMPFGTIMLGHGTRDALNNKFPAFSLLKEGFVDKEARQSLLTLGFAFGFVLISVNMIYGLLSAADVAQWQNTPQGVDWRTVFAHFPWTAIGVSFLVYIPCLMATWFSPLLILEKHMSWGKSLFYSFFGCLKNLLPIFVLGLVLLISVITVISATRSLVQVLELGDMSIYVFMPVIALLATTIYATYWPMYEALFGDTRSDAPEPSDSK